MPILLVVLFGCTGIAEAAFYKQYNRHHSEGGFIFTAMVSLFSMLFFVITDKGGFDFRPEILPYAIISGIMYCIAALLTFVAFGCGSFALSVLILSYGGIFSIIYGIFFLKESVTVFTVIGILLSFVSIFLARESRGKDEKGASAKWLICILISFFCNGMFGVMQKMQQLKFNNEVSNEFMIISLAIASLILFAIGVAKGKKDTFTVFRHGIGYAAAAGFSNGATNLIYIIAATLVDISVLSPMAAGAKIVLSFFYSLLVYREKFSGRRIIAVILGTVAVVILNLKLN